MKKNIKTLAALLIASATFVACSSDNDSIIDNQQPVNPTGKYTMTIQASKGDGATTRALNLTDHTLNATWSEGEIVEVYQGGSKIGELTAAASTDASTTLTGTFDAAPSTSADLTFYFHTNTTSYSGQDGTLATIASSYDFCAPATVATGDFTVNSANHTISVPAGISFGANQQAIIKFTLKDKGNSDAAISPTALTVTDGTSTVELTSIPAATYTANGADNVLYVAFPAAGSAKTVTLTATVGDDTYTYEKSGVTFTNGQYYEITVKMTKQAPAPTLADAFTDDAEVTVKVKTANNQWFGATGTYSATSSTYTTTGSGSVLSPSSVSMTKDGSNLVVTVTSSFNTYTVTFNFTNNTYMEDATSATSPWGMTELQSITINGVDITSTLTKVTPETITWDDTNVFGQQNVRIDYLNKGPFTYEGVSVTFTGSGDSSYLGINQKFLFVSGSEGEFTFTAPSGKQFTKIVITDNTAVTFTDYGDWKSDAAVKEATWSGTPSNTVTLGSSSNITFNELKSIVFTLQ